MGDKAPDVDCFLSFKDDKKTYEFLVQVKSSGEIEDEGNTVSSGITSDEFERMKVFHLPTYLARVDLCNQVIYIKGVFPKSDTYSRVSKTHKVTVAMIESQKICNKIASEVKRYWCEGLQNYREDFVSTIK